MVKRLSSLAATAALLVGTQAVLAERVGEFALVFGDVRSRKPGQVEYTDLAPQQHDPIVINETIQTWVASGALLSIERAAVNLAQKAEVEITREYVTEVNATTWLGAIWGRFRLMWPKSPGAARVAVKIQGARVTAPNGGEIVVEVSDGGSTVTVLVGSVLVTGSDGKTVEVRSGEQIAIVTGGIAGGVRSVGEAALAELLSSTTTQIEDQSDLLPVPVSSPPSVFLDPGWDVGKLWDHEIVPDLIPDGGYCSDLIQVGTGSVLDPVCLPTRPGPSGPTGPTGPTGFTGATTSR